MYLTAAAGYGISLYICEAAVHAAIAIYSVFIAREGVR